MRTVFPESGGLPAIEAVSVEEGSNVILRISCEQGRSFDIFYRDITSTSRFEAASGWNLAEADIPRPVSRSNGWIGEEVTGRFPGRFWAVTTCRPGGYRPGWQRPDAREQFVYGRLRQWRVIAIGVMDSVVAGSSDELSQGVVSPPTCRVKRGPILCNSRRISDRAGDLRGQSRRRRS